ncbi:MAG: anaerobic ribonucleoside-triphosphate reductase, partial [Patescibacteria group bacterium]|nr:anaerobic ribonucleoside-triphosphate reductase [Patescibacteria group bacterium]
MAVNKITKVKKRDGTIVEFNQERISDAIFKALTATGQGDGQRAKKLSDKVVQILNRRFKKEEIPTVEQIQDIVEEVLILEGLVETAKAYILYREQRRRIREAVRATEEAVERVDQYLEQLDWEVKENANMAFSLQGMNHYVTSHVIRKYWLNKIYPKEIREAHESGDLHLDKLDTLGVYCSGWDLYDLLLRGFGGVPGKLDSKPPKHLESALGQAVNFTFTLAGEVAGAVSFSNFDTLLAPFIRYDNLNYRQVKQALQEFLFNMATPTRVGFQSPFSNITLDLKPSPVFKNQPVIIGGKPQKETYGEFEEEMKIFNKALYEAWLEGDKFGRTFSVDGECLCPIKNSGKIKLVRIGEYIDKLMTRHSPIFIKEKNCQVLDTRKLNIKCLGMKNGKLDWQKVNFLIRHPENNLLQIWTVGGFNIKVTPFHSVLVLKDGKIQSFEASKLQIGDYLVAPKIVPSGENKISKISLIREFINRGKEKGIYVREVLKKNGKRLWQKRIYKNSIGHLSVFPLTWISNKLGDFDLAKAKINLAGSKIKISNYLPVNKELVEFLGWYCAEGSAEKNKKYGGISLGLNLKKEKRLAYHIGNLINKIWPEIPIVFREIKQRNLIEIRVHSKLLRRVITEIFEIGNNLEKRVPEIIYELPPQHKKIFLKAYFKGDAKITSKEISVSSISRELIYGISTLLKQLGIFHTITKYYLKGKPNWRVNIWRNEKLKSKDSHTISKVPIKESGLENVVKNILEKELYYYDSLRRKYKNTKNRIFNKFRIDNSTSLEKVKKVINYARKLKIEIPPALKEIEKGEISFFKVKKIEKTNSSRGMVYDFSTESENFVADQLLVHNSFPIPTINITKDFPWDEPAFDGIFEASAKYGINYFCLAGNTLVEKKNQGPTPISQIQPGDSILTEKKYRKVKKVFKLKSDTLIEIILKDGTKIRSTPNHRFPLVDGTLKPASKLNLSDRILTFKPKEITLSSGIKLNLNDEENFEIFKLNDDQLEKKTIDEIKEKEFIFLKPNLNFKNINDLSGFVFLAAPQSVNANLIKIPKKLSPDLSRFIGYLVGDGNYYGNGKKFPRMTFVNADKDILNDFKKIIRKLFGHSFAIDERIVGKNKKAHSLEWSSVIMRQFLLYLGLDYVKRKDKEIPKIFFLTTKENIINFLKGLFESDGTVSKKGDIFLTLTSSKIIYDVQRLLLKIGILSRVKIKREGYQIQILGRYAKEFAEKIGFISKEKNKKSKKLRFKKPCLGDYHGLAPIIFELLNKIKKEGQGLEKDLQYVYEKVKYRSRGKITPDDLKIVIGGLRNKIAFSPKYQVLSSIYKQNLFCDQVISNQAKKISAEEIIEIKTLKGNFEVFDLNVDSPTHLFVIEGKVLTHNSNYISSDMKPEDVRSMCCRLKLDLRELYNRGGGGLFGSGALTGSVSVITANLPRIGYLSKTKKEFFERLAKVMDLAKEVLEIKRKVIENLIEKGLYPYSKVYLAGVKKMRGAYYGNHFSTIGLVGMNEALLNFLGENIASKRGRRFASEVLDFMRERLVKYQKETGNIYNLEQTPAESLSYRLALKDKARYPDIITAGTKEVPYYTNSSLPYSEKILIDGRLVEIGKFVEEHLDKDTTDHYTF